MLFWKRHRHLSLSARIYIAACATFFVVMADIGYNLYSQQRLTRITRAILDQRVSMLRTTDRVKSTLMTDEAALFDYLVTSNPAQLEKRERLSQETVEEIRMLRRLSRDPIEQNDLNLLEKEVRQYSQDAQRLIRFFQETKLPNHPNLMQIVVWAHERPNLFAGLGMLSDESANRLSRIDSLCEDLISINQKLLEKEGQQINQAFDAERREAILVSIFLAVMLTGVILGHSVLLLKPLRALLRAVERVEKGQLDFEIPVVRQDEIGLLTQSFNRMTSTMSKQRQQLIRESITDELTGLYNPRHFRTLLRQEVERSMRMKNGLSLLMIDIDHFKRLNDTRGHEFGNEMIQLAAQKIRENLREIDSVARYGGDEFAVILPGALGAEAKKLAVRIGSATKNLAFSFSIGGASYPGESRSLKDLIQRADEALYAAKHAGRACVRWAEPTLSAAAEPHL